MQSPFFYSCRPAHLQTGFIFPGKSEEDEKNKNVSSEDMVRICGSFDMGWPTRSTGRTYDSLSGTAGYVGLLTGKIMCYISLNRKCKMCSLGHKPEDHDCRLNFEGSAKAMEPRAAVLLTKNNSIFIECCVELGVFIGDNDSSSIFAIRSVINYEIVKQSDKNHTSKGVVNEMYKINKKYKELNGITIKYLQKGFNYSVAQNQGDSVGMAEAIKNIPYHSFNIHTNCGTWCKYHLDPANYKHSTIDDFQDQNLFEELKCLFNILATKTNQFSAGASSNANESFNSMLASKAPKSRLYGMSSAGDIRVAFTVNKKNDGEIQVSNLAKKLTLSPGKHTIKYAKKIDASGKNRYKIALTTNFKRRRLYLKKQKTELRNKKELAEGTTYETNVGLLQNMDLPRTIASIDTNLQPIVVFFDLETGSFSKNTDILQIAAKHEDSTFSVYIKPTQKIREDASMVNGLRYINGNLQLHGNIVDTKSLPEAMREFHEFLLSFERKCILTAHNCKFDYTRLLIATKKVFMAEHFECVVAGFCDTLPLTKKFTGKNTSGENKLGTLASNFGINTNEAHNAVCDVQMLEQVLKKMNVSNETILASSLSWNQAVENENFLQELPNALKALSPLNNCTSLATRKKMIAANISYDMLLDSYKQNKLLGLLDVLGEDENGIIRVTKCRRVVQKICDYLITVPNVVTN